MNRKLKKFIKKLIKGKGVILPPPHTIPETEKETYWYARGRQEGYISAMEQVKSIQKAYAESDKAVPLAHVKLWSR